MEDIGGNQQLVGEQSISAHANTTASTITLHIPEPLFISSIVGEKKTLWPIFMDGAQLSQGYSHYKETVYFLPLSPRKSCYSFDWPWKDERLSWPCSHSVVLNEGPLDWESSTLTTRSLLHKGDTPIKPKHKHVLSSALAIFLRI